MKFFPGKTVKLSDHAHSITDIRTRINRTVSNFEMQIEIHYPSEDSKIP
jgi:hypothetical protein